MREIKFSYILQHLDTGIFVEKTSTLQEIANGSLKVFETEDFKRYFIMMDCPRQFTGLHDKNGKDIYEGDIVKTHEQEGDFIRFVDFGDGGFRLLKKDSTLTPHICFFCEEDMEVISNIYESPELLKQNV